MSERGEGTEKRSRLGRGESSRLLVAVALALSTFVVGGSATPVRAQDGFALDIYRPGVVLGRDILGVSTSDLLGHLRLAAGVTFGYVDDPLTMVDAADRDVVLTRFIDHRVTADVGLSFGLLDRLELSVDLPLVINQGGDDLAALGQPGETVPAFALGDVGARLAVRLVGGPSGFQLHVAGRLEVPTGDQDAFMSDGALRIEPSLGFGYAVDGMRVALEVGYELRSQRKASTHVNDDMLRWGLGARLPFLSGEHRLAILLSTQGTVQTGEGVDPIDPTQPLEDAPSTSFEVLGGLEWGIGPVALVAGGGVSIVRAVGSPDVRAFVGFGWVSAPSDDKDGDGLANTIDRCPDDEEDDDGFEDEDGCPDLDDDGDGVPDENDKCPRMAGDKRQRGCPASVTDGDGDGIDDAADQCPAVPEDKDGFQDTDGCPDLDNDGDGVVDTSDQCPADAEDKDGFQDEDGCPDPDNDGDGILDTADKCPTRPEVKNGLDDQDGCPDTDARDLTMTDTRIELTRPVLFAGDKVKPDSFAILDQLARLLVEHTYLTRVLVESHTDSEGNDQVNLALTQRRADAVAAYLVKKGVAPGRLVAQGVGEARPLMPNDRPDRRAKNRRVEVHLLDVDGKPVPR